jgi:hypothetical protein
MATSIVAPQRPAGFVDAPILARLVSQDNRNRPAASASIDIKNVLK